MSLPDKRKLFDAVIATLAAELGTLEAAATSARAAATDEESRAEDKHDTRATEASYLAAGQSARVAALQAQLLYFRTFEIRSFAPGSASAAGAVIKVKSGKVLQTYLLAQGAGGIRAEADGCSFQVLSLDSPLGEGLFGVRVGETVDVEIRDKVLAYEIVSVY